MLPKIKIEPYKNFNVVRDDYIIGGTKLRPLIKILPGISQETIVYAADPYGYGPVALAEATRLLNKKLHLFYPKISSLPEPMAFATGFTHVNYSLFSDLTHQTELVPKAKLYSQKNGYFFMPVGFKFSQFSEHLVDLMRKMDITPPEVWLAAGSGCLANAAKLSWPKAEINAVSLGFKHLELLPNINKHEVVERPYQEADKPPPFKSAKYYDAKIWRIVEEKANANALIWNTAG